MTSAKENRARIALVGDVSLELLAPYFRQAGFDTYVPSGFGAWRQELLDKDSPLFAFRPDLVFNVEEAAVPLSREIPGFRDERMAALASMPYSLAGIRALVEEARWRLVAKEEASSGAVRKILAVDADNTLWNGILSEDGRDALKPYADFQRGLLDLRADGVVLVLLTKNDPPAPGESFMRADMPLSDGDFASARINWAPKAGNLLEACRELRLGTESVVFLDDNPYERAQMSAHLPEVAVAPWEGKMDACLARRLRETYFPTAGATEEDRLRAASYRAALDSSARDFATAEEYLDSLDLHVAPSLAAPADLDRLAQMAGKTNQFNATTMRRTRGEFAALIEDPSKRVWVFRAGDRFAEMGIVCYIVADLAGRRLTDFVMSCRAMGRTLEHFAYAYVSRELGYEPSVDFVPTKKNGPFRAFLESGMKGPTHFIVRPQS